MPVEMWGVLSDFGPLGLLLAYMVWDKSRLDAKWREHESARLRQDEARTDADKAMALALQALTIAIRGRD